MSSPMVCRNCANENPPQSKFCNQCGKPIEVLLAVEIHDQADLTLIFEKAWDYRPDKLPTLVKFREVIASLNEHRRKCVVLKFRLDQPGRQTSVTSNAWIGQVLGLKTSAVDYALQRALRTIRPYSFR